MALTKEQRAALEAAGYTIAKSGKTIKGKDGGTIGGINENGKFFSGSKKVMDILKNPPKAEEKPAAKPAGKPAKKDDKKATNAVRPAPGGPGRLPAADKPKKTDRKDRDQQGPRKTVDKKEEKASAGMPILGVGAAAAARRAAQGRAYNPNYSGGRGGAEGFQGRYATEVGRPRAAGGARLAGGNVARGLRGPGGGAVARARDPLMLNFNKGGLVKKPAKTYKK
jgi:hypothetical protein